VICDCTISEPSPGHEPTGSTDLEYREAAVRLAIAHFEAKGMKTTQDWEILNVAKTFEQYLRNG
jgi:hypothetical protein